MPAILSTSATSVSVIGAFVRANDDWEGKFAQKPYSLKIKRHESMPGLVLFKYDEKKSDFRNPIVREARGLILDESNQFEVVCRSFDKFFAHDEEKDIQSMLQDKSECPAESVVDWSTAYCMEKVDGSLIRLFFWNGKWYVATKGMLNAYLAPIAGQDFTFGHLVEEVLDLDDLPDDLDRSMTHMFEITSEKKQVHVHYDGTQLTYLTSRYNRTGEYAQDPIAATLPLKQGHVFCLERTSLSSLDEALAYVNGHDFNTLDHEGIVVYDRSGPRLKVKTPLYALLKKGRAFHKYKDHTPNYRNMIRAILYDDRIVEHLAQMRQVKWREQYVEFMRELRAHIDTYFHKCGNELEELEAFLSDHPSNRDLRNWIRKHATHAPLHYAYTESSWDGIRSFYMTDKGVAWLAKRIAPHMADKIPPPPPAIGRPATMADKLRAQNE